MPQVLIPHIESPDLPAREKWRMAGAGGFEPPPSALTVQRPTNWTTPQQKLISSCVERDYCTMADSVLIPSKTLVLVVVSVGVAETSPARRSTAAKVCFGVRCEYRTVMAMLLWPISS